MKKLNYIISGIMGLALLAGCQEHPMTTINPAAEQEGGLTFIVNEPAYAGYTYTLSEENGANVMETLYVREQPDYGFTAATTYFAQVSFGETFEEGTYVEMEGAGSAQKIELNTKEVNKAITLLQGDNVNENPGVMDIFIRLRAHLTDKKASVTSDVQTVKDAYSNVIKLSVQPYYMLLVDALPAPYYMVGSFQGWANDANGLAAGMVPLSLVSGCSYNTVTGDGQFTITTYLEAGTEFKLVLNPGAWAPQVGQIDGKVTFKPTGDDPEPSNLAASEAGYYTLTIDTEKKEGTFEAADVAPTVFDGIELVGAWEGWGTIPIVMEAMPLRHLWIAKDVTFAEDTEGKFRKAGDWSASWGGDSFPYATVKSGNNIIITAGTYNVVFNDLDGNYYFFAK